MVTLDLDDLPPKIAQALEALTDDGELIITRAGAVVARLRLAERPVAPTPAEDLQPEGMKEIMEHFEAMIEDQF